HPYRSYGSLPLCIFEGTSPALVTACLRPGTRPPGRDNAMILVRLLAVLRRHWPQTSIGSLKGIFAPSPPATRLRQGPPVVMAMAPAAAAAAHSAAPGHAYQGQ